MRLIALGTLAFTMFTLSGCSGGAGTAAAMMITGGYIHDFDAKFGPPVRESRNEAGQRVCVYQFRNEEDMAVTDIAARVLVGMYTIGISELFHKEPEEGHPIIRRVYEFSVTFDENDFSRDFTAGHMVSAIAYYPKTGRNEQTYPPLE